MDQVCNQANACCDSGGSAKELWSAIASGSGLGFTSGIALPLAASSRKVLSFCRHHLLSCSASNTGCTPACQPAPTTCHVRMNIDCSCRNSFPSKQFYGGKAGLVLSQHAELVKKQPSYSCKLISCFCCLPLRWPAIPFPVCRSAVSDVSARFSATSQRKTALLECLSDAQLDPASRQEQECATANCTKRPKAFLVVLVSQFSVTLNCSVCVFCCTCDLSA